MTDEQPREQQPRTGMSRRTLIKRVGAGAAIAWTAPVIASVRVPAFAASVNCGTVVFSDDFEQEGCGVPEPLLDNWDIVAGTVDIVGGPTCGNGFFQLGSLSSKAVDLDGTPGAATIATKTTFPAGTYELTFDLAGSLRTGGDPTDTVTVTFGGLVDTITVANAVPLTARGPYSVVLGAPAKLQFQNDGNDFRGALLDNVVIRSCP